MTSNCIANDIAAELCDLELLEHTIMQTRDVTGQILDGIRSQAPAFLDAEIAGCSVCVHLLNAAHELKRARLLYALRGDGVADKGH
jgi:hypothetical protein